MPGTLLRLLPRSPGDARRLMLLAELGSGFLLAALALVAFSALAALRAGRRGDRRWGQVGLRAFVAGFVCVAGASATLLAALLGRDFAVAFVTDHTDRSLSLPLTAAAFYGGQEGSLLYWLLLLGACGSVALASARHRVRLAAYANLVLAAVAAFFLIVLVAVASPFALLPVTPPDGVGLNPVLRDGGMLVHPPFLLAGYSAFAVPFAFAMAALVGGEEGNDWIALTRRYALVAWGLQSVGLTLGMWWAYHVLGWGGYWGWDPVENAALLPWLVATALLHALMVQERRGMMKLWNATLALGGFCLAVFGTFVVRSGVLSSVHAFAQSPIGPFFLGFLATVLFGALALVWLRMPALRAEGAVDSLASREAAILLNNVFLVGVAGATLWGTIFPLLSEALRGQQIAVGARFYARVNGPIFVALLVLIAVGPSLRWRRTSPPTLRRLYGWPLGLAAAVAGAALLLGLRDPGVLLVGTAAALAAATVGGELARGVMARRRGGEGTGRAFARLVARDRRRWGGYLAHLGVALVAVGIATSTFLQREASATLRPGERLSIGGYTVAFNRLLDGGGPGYQAVLADLSVEGRGTAAVLRPERRAYAGWESQPTSGVAILTTWPWLDDVYVVLAGWDEDGAADLHVFVNPLVGAIWLGGALVLAGAALAGWPSPAGRPAAETAATRAAIREPVAAYGG
ncbi:MAG TPA: cytochrome c-type biogenesis CcmF C-terminal domain-containing protein [Candidatus Dormibacteraeota bacterium]|nr:cytochrome c-type biogenesis CcmF C-terminal domain-containing protein [Candidatus Dormibacteraeota bacterium]